MRRAVTATHHAMFSASATYECAANDRMQMHARLCSQLLCHGRGKQLPLDHMQIDHA